jgi:hypothetical protein
MDRYLALLIAHILADFPLQAGVIYKWKTASKLGLGLHVAIHMVVMLFMFEDPLSWWPALVALGIIHYLIDWAKLRFPVKPQTLGYIIDQALHAASLIPIALIFRNMQPTIPDQYLVFDFVLAMASPILLMFWTYTWDVREPLPNTRPYSLLTWAKRSLLPISQWIGFLSIGVIVVQVLAGVF